MRLSHFWFKTSLLHLTIINLRASMSADDSSMSAYEHELNQQVHQRSACQDCIEDYRKWYEREKTWAVLRKRCVRFLWRDFSKLEDVNYFSNGWKDFRKYVIEELQRTHFRNSCSAMRWFIFALTTVVRHIAVSLLLFSLYRLLYRCIVTCSSNFT